MSVTMLTSAPPTFVLPVEVALCATPVVRRVEVAPSMTLAGLHEVVCAAVGWSGRLLHGWSRTPGGPALWAPAWQAELFCDGSVDEASVTVDRFRSVPLVHTYGVSCPWYHRLRFGAPRRATPGTSYPRAVSARGTCPPEDLPRPSAWPPRAPSAELVAAAARLAGHTSAARPAGR